MTVHTSRIAGYGGISLVADIGGDPANPPVILMHGGGQTRHSWGYAMRELIRIGYHVISFDLRGHGESDWASQGDYSIDAFVGDLEAVATVLTRPAALVGASLGGVVALIASAKHPQSWASALVLVDVVPRMNREGVDRIHNFMKGNPQGFATIDEAADAVAGYVGHRPRPTQADGLRKNLRAGSDGRLYWHWDPKFQSSLGVDAQLMSISRRMVDAARQISAPTLIVRGKRSDVVSTEGVEHLHQLIPHAQCVDVEDAGHMVAGDRNDVFNAAVELFLNTVVKNAVHDKSTKG